MKQQQTHYIVINTLPLSNWNNIRIVLSVEPEGRRLYVWVRRAKLKSKAAHKATSMRLTPEEQHNVA